MYRPWPFVVAVRVVLVEVSVKLTVATETNARDGSVTAPASVPVLVDWAKSGIAARLRSSRGKKILANSETKFPRRTCIAKPPESCFPQRHAILLLDFETPRIWIRCL